MFAVCFEAWAAGEKSIDARAGAAVFAETVWYVRRYLTTKPKK